MLQKLWRHVFLQPLDRSPLMRAVIEILKELFESDHG